METGRTYPPLGFGNFAPTTLDQLSDDYICHLLRMYKNHRPKSALTPEMAAMLKEILAERIGLYDV